MRLRQRVLSCVGSVALVAGLTVAAGGVASAQPGTAQSTTVSAVPAAYTPDLDGGSVLQMAQVGQWLVAVGPFTSVTPHGSSTATNVDGIVAFNATTGAIDTSFHPTFDGALLSVSQGPTSNSVYVGGRFTHVNGVQRAHLVALSLSDGSAISSANPPALNGAVYAMATTHGQLLVLGNFTVVATQAHAGIASLTASNAKISSYTDVQLTGHHNYNGTGKNGAVGGRELDVSPDGTRAVVVGDFKQANGVTHDQIALLDLTDSAATLDANWNTGRFNAACARNSFDSYVEDVSFSPDGSYFVVAATGGGGISYNADGTRSLCDSASRWATTDTGTNVQPTWVDYTGNDTFWSVAATGSAVYLGGHQRWLNNPNGSDNAQSGAVPRPGLVALDPASGLPLTWNPGRNPRGGGAHALLATADGLWVGSDTKWFGNFKYQRHEIGFFPLSGGYTPASTSTQSLPADVYSAGLSNTDTLAYRSMTTTSVGAQTTASSGNIAWGSTRGAFLVGSTLFYGDTSGKFWSTTFTGNTLGTPKQVDPYDDPTWSTVQTGSGQTYRGVAPSYYSELPSVTGAFYSDGRMYYTLSGKSALYYRYFSPDSGIVGATEFTATGGNFSSVAGMFLSGNTLYYADSSQNLHSVAFSNGGTNGQNPSVDPTTDTVVSGPSVDGNTWGARSLFAAPLPPSSDIAYVDSASGYVNKNTAVSVTTPSDVAAGDTQLLYVATSDATAGQIATPAGWTKVTEQDSLPLQAAVFQQTAAASSAGSTVTVTVGAAARVEAQLVAYRGVSGAAPTTAGASDSLQASHTAPAVSVGTSGSWVVSYWADRSSTTTGWTLPGDVTQRNEVIGTGGGQLTGVLADSNIAVAAGSYPKQTASVGADNSGKAVMVSLVLPPA